MPMTSAASALVAIRPRVICPPPPCPYTPSGCCELHAQPGDMTVELERVALLRGQVHPDHVEPGPVIPNGATTRPAEQVQQLHLPRFSASRAAITNEASFLVRFLLDRISRSSISESRT